MVLSGYGFVKEVLSGDTLVIISQPSGRYPPELKLTLSSLQAPKLALKPTTMSSENLVTKDQEPFAWASRNFLRNLCIGKKVYFKVDYTIEAIGRHFGSLHLLTNTAVGKPTDISSEGFTSVSMIVAEKGWCKVKKSEKLDEKEKSGDYIKLVALNKEAETQERGIYNKENVPNTLRRVTWDFSLKTEGDKKESDAVALFNKVRGVPQKALIEYVRDGSSMKVLLLDFMTLITFNLAGVQCPRMASNKALDAEGSEGQEYAKEAKFFTEIRLLNREVSVKIEGLNEKFSTFFGTISTKRNNLNISTEIVRNGLGTPVDWSMSYTHADTASAIYAAAHIAKSARLRIWKNYSPPTISGDKSFSGTVTEILTGDSFIVSSGTPYELLVTPWTCKHTKIYLSSLRAPRMNRSGKDELCAREAKEFLRTRLVGKLVQVSVEYALTTDNVERKYATVNVSLRKKNQNVAVMLLESGLASLMSHKQGAERSHFYHDLVSAEAKAKSDGRGLWSAAKQLNKQNQNVEPVQVNTPALAKSHISSLKSEAYEKRIQGVVQYVSNGSRLKVFLPKQNLIIPVSLSGIQCARAEPEKDGDSPNMFGNEARMFTRAACLQQDVEIVIETVDKGGNFIASVFISHDFPDRKAVKTNVQNGKRNKASTDTLVNLSLLLVNYGLARTNPVGIRFARYGDDLLKAEEEAMADKAGLWLDYVPVPEVASPDESGKTESPKVINKNIAVRICHIDDGNNFYIHKQEDSEKLNDLERRLEKVSENESFQLVPELDGGVSLKPGANVLAIFNDGGKTRWYRATISSVSEKKIYVRYIDYGNEECLSSEQIRVPNDATIFEFPGLAHSASLAFTQAPALGEEYGQEAAMYLSQLTRGKELEAKVFSKEKGTKLIISLISLESFDETGDSDLQNETTVNALLLREGLATMPRRIKPYGRGASAEAEREYIRVLETEMKNAHDNHLNLWMYGDPRDDEDERQF